MALVSTLDIGELWFYNSGSMSVLVCKGRHSLLVAYHSGESRAESEQCFRVADDWLRGMREELPDEFWYQNSLKYAAVERESGGIEERKFELGDWMGIGMVGGNDPRSLGPTVFELPPRRSDVPYGWSAS